MGWDVCTTSTQIAQRDYRCQACEWVVHLGFRHGDFSVSDLRQIAKAKKDGWMIKKGQQYVKTKGKWDGEWTTFRARPEIDAICQERNVYQE